MLKQNNGMKEIFSNNFFVTTFKSYHLLRENDPYVPLNVSRSVLCTECIDGIDIRNKSILMESFS